ncbi:MAG: histidinol-phosphate transaminase [Litorilinea sp.]
MVEIVPHGTLDYAELDRLNLSPDELHVFSSNINPYGPPTAIVDAVHAAATGPNLARYPDRLSAVLRAQIADYHGVAPETIVVGNGTADLMWMVGLLHVQARRQPHGHPQGSTSRRVVILEPTFGEYANVASLVDTPVTPVALPGWERTDAGQYMPSDRSLAVCLAELAEAAPDVVFLCNPNNPTGELFDAETVDAMIGAAPNALWVIDEAYMEFVETPWSAANLIDTHAVIVLRSMTKDFALGGIRLGYLVAAPETAQPIQTAQPPWNVNVLAQIAGETAFESLVWRQATLAQLRADTAALQAALRMVGLQPRPTTTNYFLTPTPDPGALRTYLLGKRIMIRDCTSFGLPDFFRVATQTPADNALLVEALAEYAPPD